MSSFSQLSNKIYESNTENYDNWNTSELLYNDYYNEYKSIIKSEVVDNLNINRINISHEINANLNPGPKESISQLDYLRDIKENKIAKDKSRYDSVKALKEEAIVDDINILLDRLDNFPMKRNQNLQNSTNEFLNRDKSKHS